MVKIVYEMKVKKSNKGVFLHLFRSIYLDFRPFFGIFCQTFGTLQHYISKNCETKLFRTEN